MLIAQVAPLTEAIPPKLYGGTERVVYWLVEELVALGHEVTLFASGDSQTSAKLEGFWPRALRLDGSVRDANALHMSMLEHVRRQADDFDFLHFHLDYYPFSLFSRQPTPFVTTMHGRLDLPELQTVFDTFPTAPVVSISNAQRRPLPQARWVKTIYHGLPPDVCRYHASADNYFSFVGRISPEKRVDRAIEIAIGCNVPLRIAAKVDSADRAYFEQHIRPLLSHHLIDYVGEIGEDQKNDFIGNSRALLFPIDWPEPFGLVAIESLACGTPVISYPCGSVPEILCDGFDSFVVDNQQEAIAAARNIDRIARANCRASFERRFTADRMAQAYLDVYARLTSDGCTIDLPSEQWNGRQDSHRQQVVRRRHFGTQRAEPAGTQE